MDNDRAEAIALFRYRVISDALAPRLSASERGALVRQLAAVAHEGPDGTWRSFSRTTIDRWIRAYRSKGLSGLRPVRRVDAGVVRRHPEYLEEAAALRAEQPGRSAAAISDILFQRRRVRVAPRTIRSYLARRGLSRQALTAQPRTFGRFEAERANECWMVDVLHGPFVPHPKVRGSKRAKLFLVQDDHSRLIVQGLWAFEENTRAGQECLRRAILARGVPEALYADNGAPFANSMLARMCAVLGVRLLHSRPGRPEGRGKLERLNRVVRERFVLEAEAVGVESLEELNARFQAWAESWANTRVHRETGQTPIERFMAHAPHRAVDPGLLVEAFRWSVVRTVSRTAAVSLFGNRYQVDAVLCGRRVELRYDPEDLSRADVYFEGAPFGVAVPYRIGRHVHQAVPQAERPVPPPTGVDYLGLVASAHDDATTGAISYKDVPLFEPDNDDDDEGGALSGVGR